MLNDEERLRRIQDILRADRIRRSRNRLAYMQVMRGLFLRRKDPPTCRDGRGDGGSTPPPSTK